MLLFSRPVRRSQESCLTSVAPHLGSNTSPEIFGINCESSRVALSPPPPSFATSTLHHCRPNLTLTRKRIDLQGGSESTTPVQLVACLHALQTSPRGSVSPAKLDTAARGQAMEFEEYNLRPITRLSRFGRFRLLVLVGVTCSGEFVMPTLT